MVAAAFTDLMPKRVLDPWELQDLRDVIEAAAEWAAGRLPLGEFARIGHIEWQGRPSAAYTRYLALTTVGPHSAAGQLLRRAIEALVAADRRIRITAMGIVPLADWIDALGGTW